MLSKFVLSVIKKDGSTFYSQLSKPLFHFQHPEPSFHSTSNYKLCSSISIHRTTKWSKTKTTFHIENLFKILRYSSNTNNVFEAMRATGDNIHVLYLFFIDMVKNLKSFKPHLSDCDNNGILFKLGITNNLNRRAEEHMRSYNKSFDQYGLKHEVKIKLVYFVTIKDSCLTMAERELKNFYDATPSCEFVAPFSNERKVVLAMYDDFISIIHEMDELGKNLG